MNESDYIAQDLRKLDGKQLVLLDALTDSWQPTEELIKKTGLSWDYIVYMLD